MKLEVVAVALFESETLIVIAKFPVADGVPEMVPVEALSVTPLGSEPEARVNEFEPAPPLLEMVSE